MPAWSGPPPSHCSRVINDILDFSKIEAGKLELETIDFKLRGSIEPTLKTLAPRAHQKGLELNCSIEPDVPDALLGDPSRLRQILVNLLGNSLKFTEKGEINLTVQRESGDDAVTSLHFSVQDTGIGIPAEKPRTSLRPSRRRMARPPDALGARVWD